MINLFLLGREKVNGVKEDKDNSFNVVFLL